ncbi:RNA polymerase sigma-70 factor [Flavobacterium degerlachei]|jgi:RNA polymerase sigma-70 factor (ECF subfamily)|uniref:RNA polymerase sigma-70 factor, ECF subfamily n=1 Tax=Flavobacterium degerlachei TaxID=229203 RepID=A0A1H2WZZ0_9FLAO|nr:RNA polymerase sigma-70 factor [Flavobacterium degerlachei]SDW85529.1 RNA polymerase sigma-70 factor, ECF subfamily [Flavobacterium degerlachei]
MEEINHNELVQFKSFKDGDDLAFNFFFNKYYNRVLGFSIQFIYDQDEAKNVTQEAFLKLWINKHKIETVNGIQSFLFTYAKSICLNLLRHNKVKDKFRNELLNQKERQLDFEILNSIPFDVLELSELEILINKVIGELPEKTKLVYLKKRFEHKKNEEIACELGVTQKAVEAHMTKALKILKEQLSDYLPSLLIITLLNS